MAVMSAPENHRPLGPLTLDGARDLAARWVWWRSGGSDSLPNPTTTTQLAANVERMSKMCLTREDRERLVAWARERLVGYRADWEMRSIRPYAKLPPYMRATLRRYWASRLGHDLGLAATPGDTDEETPAYRLCELAGWTS